MYFYSENRSIRSVGRQFNIPESTLRYKLKTNDTHIKKVGRKPMLTEAEENVLVNYIHDSTLRAMPITRITLINSVHKILEQDVEDNVARDYFTPTTELIGWYKGFRSRHQDVVIRTPETLTRARRNLSVGIIRQWFSDIKSYLSDHNMIDILEDDTRIFNIDEIGFPLDPGTGKVLCTKGVKNCFVEQSNSHKTSITMLCMVRADGIAVAPLVIYPRKRISIGIVNEMRKIPSSFEFSVGKSNSGYINFESFYEYMINSFDQWLTANNVKRPVIVFTDWHETRVNHHLSQALDAKQIIMIGLLPNTTHMLQPLDVSVFGPLKNAWKKASRSYLRANDEFLKQDTFANVAIPLYYKFSTRTNIQNGFRRCGLYPFNDDAPDCSKVIANSARKAPSSTIFEGINQGNKNRINIE